MTGIATQSSLHLTPDIPDKPLTKGTQHFLVRKHLTSKTKARRIWEIRGMDYRKLRSN
jgi:hypothetical protein